MKNQQNRNLKKVSSGFSLVEIAVVLVIVGLIIGGGVSSYNAFVDNAYQNSTDSKLIQTKRAILDYVKVNYYMPCPAADDSGDENRAANGTCTTVKGFVPYNAIGRSRAESSDDYSNVFAYGINEDADDLTAMTNYADNPLSGEPEGTEEASYFADNQAIQARLASPDTGIDGAELPFFGLETPVTAADADSATSYIVCKKYSTNALCTDVADYEVKNISAVIVAFNENGDGVTLTNNCAGLNNGDSELENCNGDLALMRHVFKEGLFDDQIATISAYEIKQQVLDRLSGLQLDPGDDPSNPGDPLSWDNFKHIINKDLDTTNEYNNATNEAGVDVGEDGVFDDIANDEYGDSVFINGDVYKSIEMQSGSNKAYVEGDVGSSIGGGNDHDYIFINGALLGQDSDIGTGSISVQDGDDVVYINESIGWKADLNLSSGNDFAQIGGEVIGQVLGGTGNDTVFIEGSISITSRSNEVDLGDGDDTLFLGGILAEDGMLTGGGGDDHLYIHSTEAEWAADYLDSTGDTYDETSFKAATSFENIYYDIDKENVTGQGDGSTYPIYRYDYNNIQKVE